MKKAYTFDFSVVDDHIVQKQQCLTFDLNTFQAHGYAQVIFHLTSDLFIVVRSGNVENLIVKAMLTRNFSAVDKPLVAGIVNRRIGYGHTAKCSLRSSLKSRLGRLGLNEFLQKFFSGVASGQRAFSPKFWLFLGGYIQ